MVEVRAHYPQAYLRSPVPQDHVQLTENLRVPMRDGVTLCVDVYAPKSGGPYPVLLSLSPYSKDIQQNPPQWSHAIESGAVSTVASAPCRLISAATSARFSAEPLPAKLVSCTRTGPAGSGG